MRPDGKAFALLLRGLKSMAAFDSQERLRQWIRQKTPAVMRRPLGSSVTEDAFCSLFVQLHLVVRREARKTASG